MWHCQLSRRPSVLAARSQPERVIRRRDKLTGAVQCGVAQKPFLVVSAVDTAIALPADICGRKKRTKVVQKPVRWRGPVEVEAKRNDVVAARRERGPVIEAQRSPGFWIMGAWERNMGAHFFMWDRKKSHRCSRCQSNGKHVDASSFIPQHASRDVF